ncbi:MAG: alpha/beta hydrolase [Betaproteobacteria bacterium]|nr:alpha/beta hydrolase [Betaproteobacteria bacterium]
MSAWTPDKLLEGFETTEIAFPDDYEGAAWATLVRKSGMPRAPRVMLYVHGFIDYFFQAHMAERFVAEGWRFYALDLRKCGRSMSAHQRPNCCKDLEEYFADLTRAIDLVLKEEGLGRLALMGHSTGGLSCSLYADYGERRDRISALVLNSPFLDFRAPASRRRELAIACTLGRWFPYLHNPNAVLPAYVKSLHRDHAGEWQFDLRLKPVEGFGAYFGWLHAVRTGHRQVQSTLDIRCPVLSMYSDESDIVLDWHHIARFSPRLGRRVTLAQFPGAFHDLVLSRAGIREQVFVRMFEWLGQQG